MAGMSSGYHRSAFSSSQAPPMQSTRGDPHHERMQYSDSWQYQQSSTMSPYSSYPPSSRYPQSACPPGCNCAYIPAYQSYSNSSPPIESEEVDTSWDSGRRSYDTRSYDTRSYGSKTESNHIIENSDAPSEESSKYPFSVISQAIVHGLVGEQYAKSVNLSAFRVRLDPTDSQRLSGLLFFKSFTQRDANLQCTLLLQVLRYWAIEETIPIPKGQEGDDEWSGSRSKSSRDPARERRSKRKRRAPPPPRYWSRMENAAVIGLMLGLPLDLLKVVLEQREDIHLGSVDAILDTNSAEAIELLQNGNLVYSRGYTYQKLSEQDASMRSSSYPEPSEAYSVE